MSAAYTSSAFAATGDGAGYVVAHKVLVGVTGTFTGTVKLVWQDEAGVDHFVQTTLGTDLAFTAVSSLMVDLGAPVKVRAKCTAFTSGTINVMLVGAPIYSGGS